MKISTITYNTYVPYTKYIRHFTVFSAIFVFFFPPSNNTGTPFFPHPWSSMSPKNEVVVFRNRPHAVHHYNPVRLMVHHKRCVQFVSRDVSRISCLNTKPPFVFKYSLIQRVRNIVRKKIELSLWSFAKQITGFVLTMWNEFIILYENLFSIRFRDVIKLWIKLVWYVVVNSAEVTISA